MTDTPTTGHVIRKQFTYTLPDPQPAGVKLDFALRIDTKEELVSFLQCLKKAVEEVEEEIAK